MQQYGIQSGGKLPVHNHTNLPAGGQLDHGAALVGLGDSDHPAHFDIDCSKEISGIIDMEREPLTIATGIITINRSYVIVSTEAAAASDDLVTINVGAGGHILFLRAANAAQTVVVRNTGNIDTGGYGSITLDDITKIILLVYSISTGKWLLVAASDTLTKARIDALAINADQVDGIEGAEIIQRDGSVPLTAAWNVGAFEIIANMFRATSGGVIRLGEGAGQLRLVKDAAEIVKIVGQSDAIAGLKISKAIIGAFELNALVANNKVPDSDKVDGEEAAAIVTDARVKTHFPDTIANILSNHTKAVHDALNINADTLDTYEATELPRAVYLARAYQSEAQTIPNGAWTKVNLQTENYDVGTCFADSRFTSKAAGKYSMKGMVYFGPFGVDKVIEVAIYKNGSSIATHRSVTPLAGAISNNVSTDFALAVDDYIELYVKQDTGVAKDLIMGEKMTALSVHLIAFE